MKVRKISGGRNKRPGFPVEWVDRQARQDRAERKGVHLKMLKRGFALFFLVMLTFCSVCHAEIIPAYGPGQIGYSAVVLCENLTVRAEPKSNAATVTRLTYGTRMSVMTQMNGWAQVCISDDVNASPAGWVNAAYLAIDPAWYRTEGQTTVYAWNSTSAPRVALLTKDTLLPILKDDGNWLVVSLRGASGWIRKTAADYSDVQ